MRKLFPLIALLACAAMLWRAEAQRIPDARLHDLIVDGIERSGKQEYRAAMRRFDEAIRAFPRHPAGYFNKAVLLQVMSLDFETPVHAKQYLGLLEQTRHHAEAIAATAEGQYYLGMAKSYVAYYHFRDGENWLKGLQHGLSATGYLEQAVQKDADAWDARTGIGTYAYWKSRNMRFLTWTPLMDDEREKGIAMLREAERKAVYTGAQATNALIWIYIEEERWNDAIHCAQAILKQFPGNRLFLWGLASAAEGKEDWRLAREAYQRIVASIDGEVRERRYIELQARAKIALMHAKLGDETNARKEAAWVLRQKSMDLSVFTQDGKDRIERRIEEVEDMLDDL